MGSKPEDFPDFLKLLFRLSNIHGALITMPHKVTIVSLLDDASVSVKVAGSCNAVRIEAGGKLLFINTKAHPVRLDGAPAETEIVVEPVQ